MTLLPDSWQSLKQAAEQARLSGEHEQAIDLYTRALALPNVPWEIIVEITIATAYSQEMLGRFKLSETSLTGLVNKAVERGDDAVIVKAYAELLFNLRRSGDLKRGLQLGQEALKLAERTAQPGLKADILLPLVAIQAEMGDTQAAKDYLAEAKSLIQPEELRRQIKAWYVEGILLSSTGQYQDLVSNAETGLGYARQLGDRDWEGHALNSMAISSTDMALRRSYWEKALAAFEDAGDRVMQAVVISNSCDTLNEVGLFQRAWELAERAVDMSRETEQESLLSFCYQNLGGAAEGKGDLLAAINFWNQAIALTQKTGLVQLEHILYVYLGTSQLLLGDLEQARTAYQLAEQLPYKHNQAAQVYFLALQAGMSTLLGDRQTARANALQAMSILDKMIDFITGDIAVSVACWWCYRALYPAGKSVDSTQKISKAAWHALELGMRGLLIPIESLSDAGLKRGYLHRNFYRRLLIWEWLKYAPVHGVSSEQINNFTAQVQKPGRLDEVFTRLLKVGVRLNAERDPSRLPEEILDEVNELTGAERIAFILFDEQGERRMAKTLLPQPPFQAITGTLEVQPDPDDFLLEIEPWLAAASSSQGFVRWLNPQGSLAEQRSLLVAPLVSHDKLVGLIYCDLRGCFGRFEREDLDLLSVLANQSAVAVENAEWAATLEQKVADRTNELQASNQSLEQRNNELSIINEIQKGLAAELNFQAIIDLVGAKLSEVLHTDNLGIRWYDEAADLVHYLYEIEHGQRLTISPRQPTTTGSFIRLMQTHQPVVLNSVAEMQASGLEVLPGTDQSKSTVDVPIISGERFIGVIHDENFEREYAYAEAELRLLTTIAASLGTALENARLFDETQRLLAETEQRNAELAIINSVQAALAAELNIQGIYDAVGDKIREIFQSDNLEIRIYDPETNLVSIPYIYEKNQRIIIEPVPLSDAGFSAHIIHTGETLVINENMAQAVEKYGSYVVPGTTLDKSCVMVPLTVGNQVRGLVNISDFERENAFSNSDVRLLQTLVNSMSVALENARLFDETQRLFKAEQERVAELQIINSIQQGLAAELDFQAIVDLVGDKLKDLFHTGDLGITWWDEKENLVHYLYTYEHGKRLTVTPRPPKQAGIYQTLMETRKPLVFNKPEILIQDTLPGTDFSESAVYIPIISSDRFLGDISIENFERQNAFGESEIRLLTTIAASLGTALENARLFDETQRLFKAEQERVGELQVINAIQQGLAAELDFQAIVNLVGDKLREVFNTNELFITWYEEKSNTLHYLYTIEHGMPITLPPLQPQPEGPFMRIKKTRQPVIWNTIDEGDMVAGQAIAGTDISISGVMMPIISSDRVLGLIQVENYEREHAYGESEVRLLATIAASLGTALENARLFDETQRLLAETEQRNSELAIINSVQAALAAELNIQGIYDAVGDKIREIFHSDNLEIRIYDPNSNMEVYPYVYEKGERIELEPYPRIEVGISAHVAKTRQTLVINENLTEEVEKYGSYTIPGTSLARSAVYVPLIVGDQARGLVGLSDFEREHAFTDSDVRLLQTLVNSMSVALENARLFNETQRLLEETRKRASELEIINSISKSMSSQLQVEAIMRTVGDQVRDAFRSDVVNIYLYDPADNLIHIPYSYDRQYVVSESFAYGSGLTSRIIASKQPMILGSFEEITGGGAIFNPNSPVDDLMPQSYLGVPIIVGDKAIGAIDVQSYTRYVYDDSHVRLLTTLASSMGVALENARLFEETRRLLAETEQRNRELAIISRLGQALVGQLDIQNIYELMGEELRQIFDAQTVTILIYDRQTNLFHWRYVLDEGQRATVPPRPPAGFGGYILHTRQPLLIKHDLDQRAAELGSTLVVGRRPKSYLGVPLIAGGEVTGIISLQNVDREGAYTESDLRLLSTLALNMGVALENARLYQETQQRAVEMATLAEIGSDIASTHEMEPVLERLATKTRELMEVRDITLWLIQPDGVTLRSVVSLGKYSDETKATEILVGQGITGSVAESGLAEIVNQPETDPRTMHIPGTPTQEEEPEHMMLAPLISHGQTVGVMTVYRNVSQGLFNQLELDFLVSLARQAAIAIESARLYAETEQRAIEMAALAEVGREISATLELQTVLERIVGHARQLLSAGTSAVYLLQPDGITLKAIAAQGDVAQEVLADDSHLGTGIIGSIVQKGTAEWVDDTSLDPRAVHIAGTRDIDRGEKLLVAPLLKQEKAIGALAVWRDPEDAFFDWADLNFAIGLAQQAGVAIENASLFSEVQRQKEYSETLVHNSPVAIVTTDPNYIVSSWNQAAERLFGYTADETIGKNLDKLVAYQPDTKAEAVVLGEKAISGGIVECITRRCRKDGSLVDVQLSGVPVVVDGKQTGVIAIYHDLTELKKAEEAILESQRRMADIINFLPDATFVIDRDGKVIAWNHAIEDMTGVKAEDILGRGNYEYAIPFYGERRPILIDMVFYPDQEIEKKYTHIQRSEGVLIGEATSMLKGQLTYLNATASALMNSRGEAVGAIEAVRDVTAQKHAEEELKLAKSAAEAANQAKSSFLAMMSHEIRTPMNAIIGMSGLLLDTPLNPEQRDFAETIRNSGDALLTIINDILDFSKIEAGKMSLEEQPFDLRDCLESALDLMKVRASEKGLELAYQIEQGVPPALVGDVTRLRQVLINLLGNAVKFTEQGEIVLTVSGDAQASPAGKAAPAKTSLHFSVRDTGIGIPPNRISQLFRPFTQADASISRRYGGTGLGLALSKRLVEMMEGTMWAESEGLPGKGSTFHFTISAPPVLDWKGRTNMEGVQTVLRGKRMLVVDDNPTNRRILELQVQTWGMQTHAVATPLEALDLLRRGETFDLVMIDLQMPELDGVELAGEIRKLQGVGTLPLVLLSSLGGRESARESKDFSAILAKPLRQSVLFDMLMNLFAQAAQPAVRTAPGLQALDPTMASRHPLHILLAEDNVVNQKLALRLLSQMGYRADLAANGLEVLEAVQRQPYDLILMDVQMPEMDGLEATRQLCAQIPAPRRPRIVAMTANAMQGDREMCLEAGMDDYLSKPIRVDELVQALQFCQPVGEQPN